MGRVLNLGDDTKGIGGVRRGRGWSLCLRRVFCDEEVHNVAEAGAFQGGVEYQAWCPPPNPPPLPFPPSPPF